MALERNLDIISQELSYKQQVNSVGEVRGNLLPQINLSMKYLQANENSASVSNGSIARNTADARLTFQQILYSDKAWAAFSIQKYRRLSSKELLRQTKLDIVQIAAKTYLNVLLNESSLFQQRYNLQITNENLRLARNRVRSGASNKSDLYRWQSEVALSKREILRIQADLNQQKQNLNRILNQPVNQNFDTTEETLSNPLLFISDQNFVNVIQNKKDKLF